jgi:hypothetical protein
MSTIQHYINIHSIYKYANDPGRDNRFGTVSGFQETVKLVSQNHIKAEIIGQWLYCFTTALIGVQLEALGFWYSYKHSAYVYTGRSKDGIADGGLKSDETLDEIRTRLGSKTLK